MPADAQRKEVPLFISILILLCCLGLGGWFVWWYFKSPADKVVAVLEAPTPAARPERAGGARPPRRPSRNNNRPFTEGVRRVNATRWLVRADNALLCVEKPAGRETRLNLYLMNMLTPPQQEVARVRAEVLADPAAARAMGLSAAQVTELKNRSLTGGLTLEPGDLRVLQVTSEQVKALQALTFTADTPLDPQQQQALQADFNAYDAARGPNRREAIVALVRKLRMVAQVKKQPAEQMQTHQLEAISAILTPQRIEQFQKRIGHKPATQGK